nr:serine hydrolase [Methanocorpusculum labreanum]
MPGMAVAIIQNDTVVYEKCFGVINLTTQEPVNADTRFQLASISKSFTTATIASMVGTGDLAWDDSAVEINPDLQFSDPWITEHVTIRDLLSHRTGLPEYAGDELAEFGYNRSETLFKLRYLALTGAFRSSYAYSNLGITAAAETAAIKAGIPWDELISERIFIPAGMTNSSAVFSDFAEAENHADTYVVTNGVAEQTAVLFNDDANSPAGGVSSTLNDMIRYLRLQLNDGNLDGVQVIDASALSETHKAQNILLSDYTTISAYGLGWDVVSADGRVRVEHGGDFTSGVSTLITLYPAEGMGIVVLTNGFPGGHVLKKAVVRGWEDMYFTGSVQNDWYAEIEEEINAAMEPGSSVLSPYSTLPEAPENASSPRDLVNYCGSYYQDYYGTITVEEGDSGLNLYLGPAEMQYVLTPYDGDAFYEPTTGTGVYFTFDSDENVQSVNITMLDLPGRTGVFTLI